MKFHNRNINIIINEHIWIIFQQLDCTLSWKHWTNKCTENLVLLKQIHGNRNSGMITLNHINVNLPKAFLLTEEVQKNLHFSSAPSDSTTCYWHEHKIFLQGKTQTHRKATKSKKHACHTKDSESLYCWFRFYRTNMPKMLSNFK